MLSLVASRFRGRTRVGAGIAVGSLTFASVAGSATQPMFPFAKTTNATRPSRKRSQASDLQGWWQQRAHRRISDFLITLCVLTFFADMMMSNRLMLAGAKVNALISRGQAYRLLTCAFLHGNMIHLLMNMSALDNLAFLQQFFGAQRYTVIYGVSALGSSLASFFFCKAPSLGASGGICGLMGALWSFCMVNESEFASSFKNMSTRVFQNIVLCVGLGLFMPQVDNWGHVGGLLTGIAAQQLLGPRLRRTGEMESRGGRKHAVRVDTAPLRLPGVKYKGL